MRNVYLNEADSHVFRAGERVVSRHVGRYTVESGPILLEGERTYEAQDILNKAARAQLEMYGQMALRAQAALFRGASPVELSIFDDAMDGLLDRYKNSLRVAAVIVFEQAGGEYTPDDINSKL